MSSAQGIPMRTVYVQPQYYEDSDGNQYTWYVWEGAEVAVILETMSPEVDNKERVERCPG